MTWKHDDLAGDLAQHLRCSGDRMVWENMQMGPSGSPRPDVFTLAKSYSKPMPASYEVKVSRADFLADCNAAKWQSYLPFSAGIFFAVPYGLVKKDEIPAGAGLIYRHDQIWRVAKAPRWGKYQLDRDVMMKLLIDGVDRLRCDPKFRRGDIWSNEKSLRKALGERAATVVRDIDLAEGRIKLLEQRRKDIDAEFKEREAQMRERADADAKRHREHVESMIATHLRPIRTLCGLPDDATPQAIAAAMKKAAQGLNHNEYVRFLEQRLEMIRTALTQASELKFVPVKKQVTPTP